MVKFSLFSSSIFQQSYFFVQVDSITLKDLSVFNGEANLFSLIDLSTSIIGSDQLRSYLQHPSNSIENLLSIQACVLYWTRHLDDWDSLISNGTLVMLKDFFEHSDGLQYRPSSLMFSLDAKLQKLFNKNAYSLLQFSVFHLIDLVKGLQQLVQIEDENTPVLVQQAHAIFIDFLAQDASKELLQLDKKSPLRRLMHAGYMARRELKRYLSRMMDAFAKMDAWHAMAKAGQTLGFTMPEIVNQEGMILEGEGLFHPLLTHPVPFDLSLDKSQNMLFLTGANMSGKSTLMRTLGLGALLAHIGMAVPATHFKISFLEGIITNMQVEDNIFKGESYFFAEVQRMKTTAQKIQKSKRHLVLMDELFKGTNVHDAYECSKAVIKALISHKDNLLALSTHLYELYDDLKMEKSVAFRYFNTIINEEDRYSFTYKLKEGVSNDKIGFLVLKQEGVLDMLNSKAV